MTPSKRLFAFLFLVATMFSGFTQSSAQKIKDWDELDIYLRSLEPAETVSGYESVSARLPKPRWEDYGYESVVLLAAKAYQRLGAESKRAELFKEAVANMERILKQVEAEGDLDDYKEYCWSIGNMCQAAGFKEKQDYYYDQRENADPKTAGHEWDAVSEKIGQLYIAGDHAGAKSLYEKTVSSLGEPKPGSNSYTTLIAYMVGVYAALGDQQKSALMSQKMMNQALAGMDEDQAALYNQSLGSANQMLQDIEQTQENQKAQVDANQIGTRLGAEQEVLPDFGDFQMPAQTREMWEQMVYMNEEYQNAAADKKELVKNRLAREQLGGMIKEIDPNALIPKNATFDEVFDLMDQVVKSQFKTYEDQFKDSGLEEGVKEIREGLNEDVSGIIDFYSYLIKENENIMLFSKSDYDAVSSLTQTFPDKASDKQAVSEIIGAAIIQSRTSVGQSMSKPEENWLKSVVQNMLDDYGKVLGQEFDLIAFSSISGGEEENYFEVFAEMIANCEDVRIRHETDYYKIIREELIRADKAGEIIAVNDIHDLSLGSQQLDNWAKYQEVFDRAALKVIEQDLFDIFEENAPVDYNEMLANRALDYKTQRFLMEGVRASGDAELISMYNDLRQKKEAIGGVSMMPDTTQTRMGWDRATKERTINDIKEKERIIYKRILKVSDFATFAQSYFIKWQEIQNSLEPNEVFVDVRRIQDLKSGDNRAEVSYLYVIIKAIGKPETVISKNILTEERLYIKLKSKELSNTEKDGRKPDDEYADHSVYDNFWAPIDKKFKGAIDRVYLNPDGLYHNLSFDCMILPDNRFLSDEMEVIRLVEIADIRKHSARTQASPEYKRSFYFFGFPAYNDTPSGAEKVDDAFSRNLGKVYKSMFVHLGRITDLPGALAEVTTIDSLAKSNGYDSKLLTHLEANESRLKSLEGADILHFATHGKYVQESDESSKKLSHREQKLIENPMLRSQIFLAGAERARKGKIINADNGIVTAEEISHLDLGGTKLVVLSACETALGKTYSGEGIYGLQRAFLQAGAESVVISLWEVSDEATRLLMTEFYKNLLVKDMPKYSAFNAAKLSVKEKYPHPHYWAPFIMVGR